MTEADPTTLEQIRRAELAQARRLEDVDDEGRAALGEARRQADRLVEAGRQRGRQQADERYELALAAAEERAAEIAADGRARAERIRSKAAGQLEVAVDSMLAVVLARPGMEID